VLSLLRIVQVNGDFDACFELALRDLVLENRKLHGGIFDFSSSGCCKQRNSLDNTCSVDVLLGSLDHPLSSGVSQKHVRSVCWLDESCSLLVLWLVADVLTAACTDMLD
jgi:hypothetical protein